MDMHETATAMLRGRHGEIAILEKAEVSGRIDGPLAEMAMSQHYRNAEPAAIEAVFTFPLPLDAVLLRFAAEIGGRNLEGTIVPRRVAERGYEDAIAGGDAAMMLEQAAPGLYTASVGNLMPGETAIVRITWGQFLRWNGSLVRLMLPTTLAPRYGDPLAGVREPHQVPAASLMVERPFSVEIAVSGPLAAARIGSPSHQVAAERTATGTVIRSTGTPPMDRDFVLEMRLEGDGSCALNSADRTGRVVVASFRPEIAAGQAEPRAVTVVVDCSGSMAGDSIAQARIALTRIVDGLRPGDLFDIIAFGSRHQALFGHPMPADEEHVSQARRFVRRLQANLGGTETGAALEAAWAGHVTQAMPHDLLLITDGQITGWQHIVDRARRSGSRVFTVGVGSASAEAFLSDLARATNAAAEFVSPREDMAERIHRHFQRMYAPQAAARVIWPGRPSRTLPARLEAVFGGDTVLAFAWYEGDPSGKVRLEVSPTGATATVQEAEVTAVPETAVGASGSGPAPALARMVAARRLDVGLEDAEAERLAVDYQLVSRWTNALVVHRRAEGEKADSLPVIRTVAHTVAAGWHGLGFVSASSAQCYAAAVPDLDMDIPTFSRRSRREASSGPIKGPSLFERVTGSGRGLPGKNRGGMGIDLPDEIWDAAAIRDLRNLGVSDEVCSLLDGSVAGGLFEASAMAIFLGVLAGTEAARTLDRGRRRGFAASLLALKVDPGTVSRIENAVRSWVGE